MASYEEATFEERVEHFGKRCIPIENKLAMSVAAEAQKILDDTNLRIVAFEASDKILAHQREKFRDALNDLQLLEAEYRHAHDHAGDGSQAAGAAWDHMRAAGDRARALLERWPAIEKEEKEVVDG